MTATLHITANLMPDRHRRPCSQFHRVCLRLGLGRVIAFEDEFPHQWIQVATYANNRECKWAPCNVKLVRILLEDD